MRKKQNGKNLKKKQSAQVSTPVESDDSIFDDEDETLVSSYSKNTRKMIGDIKNQIGNTDTNDPKYKELTDRLGKLEQDEAERKSQADAEEARKAKLREQNKQNKKLFAEIELFQNQRDKNTGAYLFDDLRTEKRFEEIHEQFSKFKEKLMNYKETSSPKEQDRILMSYFDEERGAALREETERIGIVPPEEVDKYFQIVELIDLMNGVEYDPVLERFIEVKNKLGEKVKYRSLDETYRVKNYYKELNKNRKKVSKQISNKLQQLNNRPVEIGNNETAPIDQGLQPDQIRDVIEHAHLYVKDKKRYDILVRAYNAIGQQPPAYRGR
jgi:hypothetical protein